MHASRVPEEDIRLKMFCRIFFNPFLLGQSLDNGETVHVSNLEILGEGVC